MTGNEMLSTLGLRLEDPAESNFTQSAKLDALNIAQRSVVNLVHNAYLTDLQVIDSSKTMSGGNLAFSGLTSVPIRNGIVAVKANGGKWATMIEPTDLKRLENTYLAGSTQNPIAYVFTEKIYVEGISATANIDVWYMKAPTAIAASGTECELNIALHESVIDMAESQLWKMDAKVDRANAAYANAVAQLEALNARYAAEGPTGIGTQNRA